MTRNSIGMNNATGVIFRGVVLSLLTTLIGAALCAVAVLREMVAEDKLSYCAWMVMLVAAGVGTVTGKKENRLKTSLIIGAIYTVVLLAFTALLFGGQYEGVGVSLLIVLSGCVAAVMLTRKRNIKVKLRRNRIRRR